MFRDGNDFLFIVSLSDLIAWPAIIGAHTGVLVAFNVVIALHYIVSKYSIGNSSNFFETLYRRPPYIIFFNSKAVCVIILFTFCVYFFAQHRENALLHHQNKCTKKEWRAFITLNKQVLRSSVWTLTFPNIKWAGLSNNCNCYRYLLRGLLFYLLLVYLFFTCTCTHTESYDGTAQCEF